MTVSLTLPQLAASLTEAQREALCEYGRFEDAIGTFVHARTRRALQGKGLVEPEMYSVKLTPLGLALRAHLIESQKHD